MGTVLLTGSHNTLDGSNKPPALEPSLLDQDEPWFVTRRSKESWEMTIAMLRSLVALPGINASVSLELTSDQLNRPALALSGRMWGRLWLDESGIPILHFTHDSRFDNYPFMHLYQWLENEWPTGLDWDSPEYAATCKLWQDRNKWLDFFERRLAREAEVLREKATELHVAGLDKLRLAKRISKRRLILPRET